MATFLELECKGVEHEKFNLGFLLKVSKFSKKINRKYSIAVSNGTAALEIVIKALGIKKNDEVIIPNFTIISNALAVIKQNAKPVLIDCDLKTWNINIDEIEKKN